MKKLFSLVVLLAAFVAWALLAPFAGFSGAAFVDLPLGSGSSGIARALAGQGVIRYPWQFLLVRLVKPSAVLQAGEYRFTRSASVLDVFNRISRGDIYFVQFTVPEGSNMFDIARSLDAEGLMAAEDFLKAASNPASIADLAPHARNLEGYLFPSTYRLPHGISAAPLCRLMTNEFRRVWGKLARGGAADPQRTVTLASLVEKETAAPAERPLVAGVFTNRLAQKMRLDCDPTTIYAALLDRRYRGKIHRSDLDSENPYNTYKHDGLPPGPIANPGESSLMAALMPADTRFLYFVAKPGGGEHQFSENIAGHEKAVTAYRAANRHATTQGKSR